MSRTQRRLRLRLSHLLQPRNGDIDFLSTYQSAIYSKDRCDSMGTLPVFKCQLIHLEGMFFSEVGRYFG